MSNESSFNRSSPLRIPVKPCRKLQTKHHPTDVPPLAVQLLRSLHNDRRQSVVSRRLSIGKTVHQTEDLLDRSCMDQFDDSFTLNLDGSQPLTPRKSPHLIRRPSISHLNKKHKANVSSATNYPAGTSAGIASRKKVSSVRKRMISTMRKVLSGRRTGYSRL